MRGDFPENRTFNFKRKMTTVERQEEGRSRYFRGILTNRGRLFGRIHNEKSRDSYAPCWSYFIRQKQLFYRHICYCLYVTIFTEKLNKTYFSSHNSILNSWSIELYPETQQCEN